MEQPVIGCWAGRRAGPGTGRSNGRPHQSIIIFLSIYREFLIFSELNGHRAYIMSFYLIVLQDTKHKNK